MAACSSSHGGLLISRLQHEVGWRISGPMYCIVWLVAVRQPPPPPPKGRPHGGPGTANPWQTSQRILLKALYVVSMSCQCGVKLWCRLFAGCDFCLHQKIQQGCIGIGSMQGGAGQGTWCRPLFSVFCFVLQLVCQALKVVLEWVLLEWVVRLHAAQYQARYCADCDVEAAASWAEGLPAGPGYRAGRVLPGPATTLMHSVVAQWSLCALQG